MKIHKAMVWGCLLMVCLGTAVSIHSRVHRKLSTLHRRHIDERPRSLERDQEILAADMNHLRRDLRRGSSPMASSAEREAIRQDWLDIVTDRGIMRDKLAPAPFVHRSKNFD